MYQAPSTKHQAPSTKHQAPSTKHHFILTLLFALFTNVFALNAQEFQCGYKLSASALNDYYQRVNTLVYNNSSMQSAQPLSMSNLEIQIKANKGQFKNY